MAYPAITNFVFPDHLDLIRFRQGHHGIHFMVQVAYRAMFDTPDGVTHTVTVPPGTTTDFASIPRVFQSIVTKLGPHIEAAVIHDHLCITRENSGYTSKEAADIFYAGMIAGGTPRRTAWMMWKAVCWGGPRW